MLVRMIKYQKEIYHGRALKLTENTCAREVTGYRIVCGNKSSILIDQIELRTQFNQFEMFVSSLIHERTLKTVLLYKDAVLRENHLNRESKSLYLTIQLYICYKHESPSSCITTAYLSFMKELHRILTKIHQVISHQLFSHKENQGQSLPINEQSIYGLPRWKA